MAQTEAVLEAVERHRDDIMRTLNDLNATPEPGFKEYRTSSYLKDALRRAGIKVIELTETGFAAEVSGERPGPVIGLRADIDALPFKNERGEMYYVHACGHSANSTMVLWATIILNELNLVKRGKLRAIFQPAEETLQGAEAIARTGIVADMTELYGVHLRPIHEARLGQATPALRHAGASSIEVTISGRTAHAARPHLAVNPIVGAALAVLSVNSIWLDPTQHWSVVPTMISGGVTHNVIPESVSLVFNLRFATNKLMDELESKLRQACEHAVASIGGSVKFKHLGSVPAAEYDSDAVGNLAEAIKAVLGPQGLISEIYTPGSEDFHIYRKYNQQIKTAYLGVGADLTPGLHDPTMTYNKEAVVIGTKILALAAMRRLYS